MAIRTDIWPTISTRICPSEDGTKVAVQVYVYMNGYARWHRTRDFPTSVDVKTISEYLAVQQGEALAYISAEIVDTAA